MPWKLQKCLLCMFCCLYNRESVGLEGIDLRGVVTTTVGHESVTSCNLQLYEPHSRKMGLNAGE